MFHRFNPFYTMKKKEQKPETFVTYLKVSPYLKSWMECKYGKYICFPFMSRQYSCLCRYLVNNSSMSAITDFSFSEKAFNYNSPDSFFVSSPSKEVKEQCIAIQMPPVVFRGYQEIQVDGYWQLSKQGAIELRQIIKNDFMVDLFTFIDECFTNARLNGGKVTREQAIDDFITMHGIDMSWRENFWTYVKREKKCMKEEIENRREEMEKKYDRQFCYT